MPDAHSSHALLIDEITTLRNQLSDSKKLAEYRLEEIKRLMLRDPHAQIATIYGIPIEHYADFLIALEERAGTKADAVLAEITTLRTRLSEAEAEVRSLIKEHGQMSEALLDADRKREEAERALRVLVDSLNAWERKEFASTSEAVVVMRAMILRYGDIALPAQEKQSDKEKP